MKEHRGRLELRSMTQSIFRRGNCLDKAAEEGFFGTLKPKYLQVTNVTGLDELKDVSDDDSRCYNIGGIKRKLESLSPIDFRMGCMSGQH